MDESLATALSAIEDLDKRILKVAEAMIGAHGGDMYGVDLLANAAMNRSLALSSGFRTLIAAQNLLCAGALLRLQIDTALRFSAAFLVEKPHEFAIAVLGGTPVNKLRDMSGKLLTDGYLRKRLAEVAPWVDRVYQRTSGFVHLSDVHYFATVDEVHNDRRITFKIGAKDKRIPESHYAEAAEAFAESMRVLLQFLEGWVFTKDNPELVERMRHYRTQE
ncbi:MAG: hypothetical protein NTW86_28245 [Candidatus Sumerlaeota bacterium]|nr:hypothetical protein [Candidatus Sumerlaeota bacterium]